MACTLTSISLDCELSGVGGIQKFYATDVESISFETPTGMTLSLTDISLDGETTISGLTASFEEFEGLRATAGLTETLSMGDRGSNLYTSVLTAGFAKITAAKQEALKALASKSKLCVIALDYNNQYFLVGNEHGAYLSAANNQTGVAAGDQNGLSLEITGVAGRPMYQIII